jgi:glycosyltransferase involved in cell wall biosynthesis
LLVKPADAASLSNAILELLQDEDRAKSLGEAARVFIKENFSQEKMVLKTEEVYLECVGAKD